MAKVIGVIAALLLPVLAWAQEAAPVPAADYVSLCLALWDGAPDLQAKASALGLQDATGAAGAAFSVGKSTIEFLRSADGGRTVGATFTTFEDGKESACDINLSVALQRADLETVQRTLDLDGQVVTVGPAMMARWKMRKRQPAVLLKAVVGNSITTLTLVKFDPAPAAPGVRENR